MFKKIFLRDDTYFSSILNYSNVTVMKDISTVIEDILSTPLLDCN